MIEKLAKAKELLQEEIDYPIVSAYEFSEDDILFVVQESEEVVEDPFYVVNVENGLIIRFSPFEDLERFDLALSKKLEDDHYD